MASPETFQTDHAEPDSPTPTRVRYMLMGYLCALSAIMYLDRVCIAQALVSIQGELGISNSRAGWVLAAFTLAYAIFEVPTGAWGDRVGARRVITRIAIWWSVFTALTGACWNLGSLLAVRFLFGAGEAGAFPNVARVFSRWYPTEERGRAPGFMTFASLQGGSLAPVLAAYLIGAIGWRPTFVVFGAIGIVWAACFHSWFRDDPADHPSVNEAELALIRRGAKPGKREHGAIPWAAVSRTPTIWLLGLSMTCSSFNSYLYFSWFPKYLQTGRGVDPLTSGWLASGVLECGAFGMLLGGFLVDLVCGRGPGYLGRRRLVACSTSVLAAVLLVVGVTREDPRATTLLAGLSCFAAMSLNALWWASAMEVSGKHIGALFGLMNSMGVVGAAGSQLFFGAFADWRASRGFVGRDQWDPAFFVDAGVLVLGACCWFFIDPSRPVDHRDESIDDEDF